jgi:hypothetical protein
VGQFVRPSNAPADRTATITTGDADENPRRESKTIGFAPGTHRSERERDADMFVQYLKTKNFHRHCQVRNFVAFIAPDARRILPSAICDAADVTSSEAVIGCGDAARAPLNWS